MGPIDTFWVPAGVIKLDRSQEKNGSTTRPEWWRWICRMAQSAPGRKLSVGKGAIGG